ncbi:hypothetical protein ACNVED_09225 [Legionella sp. D16C41]|uniref:hypothetical protein n=1 Tax=Legionella sp. D16C41 TaxID=3402688 RepID=UPI003AF9C4EA
MFTDVSRICGSALIDKKNRFCKIKFVVVSIGLSSLTYGEVSPNLDTKFYHPKQTLTSKPTVLTNKKIYLGGITLTPGGFFALEGVWRSRNITSDIGSNFAAIPTLNLPQAYLHEFRLSARQSRLSLLAEGSVNSETLLSGYVETDFLGNGSGNSNESNSFDLRIRQFYANIDWKTSGWHILGGQAWSLITTFTQGIKARSEATPPTIDAQYVVGFAWKRQPQLRLTKNFGEKIWLAISAENPQTTFGGTPICTPLGTGAVFGAISNIFCSAPGIATLPSVNNFSFNQVPDVIGKLAFDSQLGGIKLHLESFGLYRQFYDRVYLNHNTIRHNITTNSYGGGFGGVIEVFPQLFDIQGNFLSGKGIGSYLAGLLPDVTFRSDGGLAPIQETGFMVGGTLHITPALDLYIFGGKEVQQAKFFYAAIPNNFFGLGIPNANNIGCNFETGICNGHIRELWQISGGFWDKAYDGAYGQLKVGLQYSYTEKILFSGTGAHVGPVIRGKLIGGKTNEQMVFFSLRYFPFSVSSNSKLEYVK